MTTHIDQAVEPLQRTSFEAARLMAEHPPVWRDRNKQTVFEISSPPGCVHAGEITYTRWPSMPLPEDVDVRACLDLLEVRPSVYDYVPAYPDGAAVEWHVNFADPSLFVAYGSPLLAQDELQAAEHPALGAIREALAASGHPAVTEEDGQSTPVLIMGVERRCHIALDPNSDEGRPVGLYGAAFARAPEDAVRRATTAIAPPTITNLIAIAAPSCGRGQYTRDQIEQAIVPAYSGFRAACWESERSRGALPVAVHTGFWGAGVFGGNRVLMTIVQILAAGMAGIDRLVFHTAGPGGKPVVKMARRQIEQELAGERAIRTSDLLNRIDGLGFLWGMGDGN